MTMKMRELLGLKPMFDPRVFAPADEGAGDGGGDDAAAGGDAGGSDDAGDDQSSSATGGDDAAGKKAGVALDGGTAKGQDNSDEGDDSDDSTDDKDGKGKNDDADDDTVPETYTFENLPEGYELDQGMADAFSPVFKDLGLSQGKVDKLVATMAEVQKGQTDALVEQAAATVNGWRTAAEKDKEIGGKNWEASVQAGNDLLRKFGSDALIKDVMVDLGVGNHPEVIRFLRNIRAAFADDVFETGQETDTSKPVAPEEAWYKTTPTTKKG